MAYLTFEKLKNLGGQPSQITKAFSLNESFGQVPSTAKRVFLSYRRKDVNYVKPIVSLLKSLGVIVYIDYLDDNLPNPPDHTTASILRASLMKCQKFILLATPNSNQSNWMPWELGLGDGFTGYDNTIIFPLVENEDIWSEREYYKIYGYVKEANGENLIKRDWAIFYPDKKPIWLKEWLKK